MCNEPSCSADKSNRMAVEDGNGIWRRVTSQDDPGDDPSPVTLEVLHDFKRRPSQTLATVRSTPIAAAIAAARNTAASATSVTISNNNNVVNNNNSSNNNNSNNVTSKSRKAPRIVKQTSQAASSNKTSIGEIGLDILKLQAGMKGFRQLQKVEALLASPEATSSAKKSVSAHNMSVLLNEQRCELCNEEGEKKVRRCSHSSVQPRRKITPPVAGTVPPSLTAPPTRGKLSAQHRMATIDPEAFRHAESPNKDDHAALDTNNSTRRPSFNTKPPNPSATYVNDSNLPNSRGNAFSDERAPLTCEDASCKFEFPVPQMRRYSVFLQAPKMRSDDTSFEHSSCGIGLGLTGISIGYRLGRRKTLYKRRRWIADYLLAIATFGVILAIVETEMTVVGVYSKESIHSFCVKSLISLSTVILLILLCLFHVLEIQLFSIDNCVEDWRVAINGRRFANLLVELMICAIHTFPMPADAEWAYFTWTIIHASGKITSKVVSIDHILVLPMFLRFYLCFRVMLLHSKLFTDASSRSIGALNRIKFNIRFVLKTLMTICPGTVLLVLILSLLIVASWTIRICEGFHDVAYRNIFNSLWFVSITFLSIGYGDIVPSSLCGRLIGITTGILGSGCTALVVAVVARKLELSRAEKHVHNFMLDTQLTKQLKNAAANVLRETWLIYKYTKLAKRIQPSKIRHHQRRFLAAIQELRKVKIAQRKLMENSTRLVDLPKLHHQLHDIVTESRKDQAVLGNRLNEIESRLQSLEREIRFLPALLGDEILRRLNGKPIHNQPVTPSASNVNFLSFTNTANTKQEPTESDNPCSTW